MVKCKDKFKFKFKSKSMACFSKKAMSAVLSAAMVCMTMTSVYMPAAGVVYAAEETDSNEAESGGGATAVAGGGSLTVSNAVTGHRYRVYQIFTGNVNADGTTLSNIKYGMNYGEAGVAVPDEELEGIEDAKAFAKKLTSDNTGGVLLVSQSLSLRLKIPRHS